MQGSIQTLALALALQKGSLAAGARKETEDPNHTGVVWFKKLTLTTAHTRVCAHALALTHARTQNHTHSHTQMQKEKKKNQSCTLDMSQTHLHALHRRKDVLLETLKLD